MQLANVILTTLPETNLSISWNAIDWQMVNRRVNNLRRRIYRASVGGNLKVVSSLQKMMLKSHSNRLLAIRRVTQINQGRKSPGIDQIIVNTDKERSWLLDKLITENKPQASPIRRVYIPKKNGKLRPLGLPTILDRSRQAVIKSALEPYWEAKFESCSYGFRPGRSAQDAMQKIFCIARPGKSRKWVLEVDIKGAFDNISHDFLLKAVGNFPARGWIREWLKAGVMEKGRTTPQPAGTPQGSVISPLLANIALHGMEEALQVSYNKYGSIRTESPYALVTYADDSVVFAKSEEACHQAKEQLLVWLQERGLELSKEKTSIRHIEEGFDFLGFHVKQYKATNKKKGIILLIRPSRESIRAFKKQMTIEWKKGLSWTTQRVIENLNPKIKGWASYFRAVASKRTFSQIDYWMWSKQDWYSYRKHPNKSWQWRKAKYWGKIKGRNDRWVFMEKENRKELFLWKLGWTPIKRHTLVKRGYSPDNPQLQAYWKERQSKKSGYLFKTRSILWRRQKGQCRVCLDSIDNGEQIEIHHLLPRKLGGKDNIDNLAMLHSACHKQVHSKLGKQTTGVSKLLEPYAGQLARTVLREESA
jgi:RNA-directed DNA polymerase